MSGQRIIRVPKNYYDELLQAQQELSKQRYKRVPLWECTQHVAIQKHLDQQRWRDHEWFLPKKNRKGSLFDMFAILFVIAVALVVMIVGILFINGLQSAIAGDAAVPSQGKQFINNIQSQNAWVLDFIFVMLLISLPMVSAILAYFNNLPPFLFWASIGVILLVIVLANIIGDAYINITGVDGISTVTSSIPMTHFIMSHFVLYAFLCCVIIMFGVFLKPKNQYGYGP